MNNSSETSPQSSNLSPDDEINLLDYWRVIWKRRRLIAGLFGATVLMAMIISLLMPKIYESTATLLPPLGSQGGSGLGGLLAGSGAAQSFGISLPGMPTTPTDVFAAMLKSRVMADAVIKQFDLMRLWKTETMQPARKALESMTDIKVAKEKVITITVAAKDPQLAADIANFYVSNLDHLNQVLTISKASQKRAFVEERLVETQAALVKAEEKLKDFQTQNKTVSLDVQGHAAIEAAAAIQGRISATEVRLQVAQNSLTPDNPDVVTLRLELQQLKKQLYLLEFGEGGKGRVPGNRMHPAFTTVPSLALELGRRMREVKVQETLYTMLASEYEEAKITEARDTPTVQVLDPAIPAEKKSKPSIRLNMMIAGALALFLGIVLVFVLEYLERVIGKPIQEEWEGRIRHFYLESVEQVKGKLQRRREQ